VKPMVRPFPPLHGHDRLRDPVRDRPTRLLHRLALSWLYANYTEDRRAAPVDADGYVGGWDGIDGREWGEV
jgi:hypothetical protein